MILDVIEYMVCERECINGWIETRIWEDLRAGVIASIGEIRREGGGTPTWGGCGASRTPLPPQRGQLNFRDLTSPGVSWPLWSGPPYLSNLQGFIGFMF